ncbi:mCG1047789 [Mus musculus]|nr:mCG1047789 [Mus musculus]
MKAQSRGLLSIQVAVIGMEAVSNCQGGRNILRQCSPWCNSPCGRTYLKHTWHGKADVEAVPGSGARCPSHPASRQ